MTVTQVAKAIYQDVMSGRFGYEEAKWLYGGHLSPRDWRLVDYVFDELYA